MEGAHELGGRHVVEVARRAQDFVRHRVPGTARVDEHQVSANAVRPLQLVHVIVCMRVLACLHRRRMDFGEKSLLARRDGRRVAVADELEDRASAWAPFLDETACLSVISPGLLAVHRRCVVSNEHERVYPGGSDDDSHSSPYLERRREGRDDDFRRRLPSPRSPSAGLRWGSSDDAWL